MPIKTKRWCVPAEPDDGLRILVCRYRPRALPKAKETWDVWMRDLGPSPELFDAFYGKGRAPITLDEYRERYTHEMQAQQDKIAELAARVDRGETVTLLCSKDCILEQACHRSMLAALIQAARRASPGRAPLP
ncbi:MAG: DUF488 domain-containing protein [Hyalangium sp.]|uniref:DUF488 domain-containing protein n=1 Tax=Hyalangium sp. TaxID=2028555 RepID=UPI0038999355